VDKEKLSKWSSIAEILSSVAVLVTLVFLVIEFRQNNALIEQNNRAIRDAAIQSLDEGVLTIVNMLAAEEKNAVLFSKGLSDYDNLSEDQKIHFAALINAVCLRMERPAASASLETRRECVNRPCKQSRRTSSLERLQC